MPGFDGKGSGFYRRGRRCGPCGRGYKRGNDFYELNKRLNNSNSENQLECLKEKIEKLEKENMLLNETIKRLKIK